MSQLAALLKEYFERSPYQTVNDLTVAAQIHAPMSKSYVAHILRGARENPAYDKLMAIAYALKLGQRDTNLLLQAAGLPTMPAFDPQSERILLSVQQLIQTPGISPEAIKMIVDSMVMMVEGVRAGLSGTPPAVSSLPTVATLPLRPLPATLLSPEEGVLDDLLGEFLAQDEDHPLDTLFQSLSEAAQGDRWEVKRRIAEALPRLVQLQPEATVRVANILRQDYHPDYRADIRRRVVEAVPELYKQRPNEALQLLESRNRDEVYMAMAAVEVLHDMEKTGAITAGVADRYINALQVDKPLHQEVVAYLHQLLRQARTAPDAVLERMNGDRVHPERLIRICIQRIAPRLLEERPSEALALMAYFLRRGDDDKPAEHQNLRRPVSKALPEILDLLVAAPEFRGKVAELLLTLAPDPDIHVRRALGDALDRVVIVDAELGVAILNILVGDQDPYVRQRAWRTLLQLGDLYPEQAEIYYSRVLTPVRAG